MENEDFAIGKVYENVWKMIWNEMYIFADGFVYFNLIVYYEKVYIVVLLNNGAFKAYLLYFFLFCK